jgi:methyltransferase (TIGR00027 family)
MYSRRPSRTAEYNAAFRAAESVKPAGVRLVDDPYAARLLPCDLRLLVWISAMPVAGKLLERFVDAKWPGMRSSVIARTRLIDDWVSEALDAGIAQLVFLGAGYDVRAWRLPAAARTRVFEVDHPATSASKRGRLEHLAVDLGHVCFVPVDFDRETVADQLAETDFDPAQPAVVLWDGVSNYLQPGAVDAIVTWVGGLAEGGRFIFTYVHSGVLDGSQFFAGGTAATRATRKAGEPWTFGMCPEDVADYLRQRRLRLLADLGADEYRVRTMGPIAQQIKGYGFYHAALAEISQNA